MAQSLTREQLLDVANTYGTPLYVYHAEKIKEQFSTLQSAFEGVNARFFYASKALTNISVLKYIYHLGCNVDCSSINEVKMALHAGFPAERILYTSNGIAFEEIAEAKSLGVNINIDSISNLKKFGQAFGHSYPVGLRLRPNIMAGGNLKISTGHDKSKFGIPVEQIDEVLAVVEAENIFVRGLHIHTGSEIKDVEVFAKGMAVLFELLPHFKELAFLDLGGGFKVPYKEGEEGTNISALAAQIKSAFAAHPLASGLEVWFEPGKYMVSECGYFLTQVNVLKHNKNATFVGINSGFNHLIRPMFYDAYHRIENLTNPEGNMQSYAITGNICETDTFAWDRALPEVREGDILVFRNAGAYGFEMSSNFNSRQRPAEVMMVEGQARIIRQRETFDELLRNQVQIF